MYLSDKISTQICNNLLKHEIIEKDNYPYYQYSFDFVMDLLLFHASLIILGILLNAPFLSLLYIATLSPIKMVSGGAHAGNRISCSFISYTVFLLTILSVQHQVFLLKSYAAAILYATSAILIFLLTPVDSKNKRIPESKRKSYKKRCLILLSCLSLLFVFFVRRGCPRSFSLMSLCVFTILLNQILGIIINYIDDRKDKACFS